MMNKKNWIVVFALAILSYSIMAQQEQQQPVNTIRLSSISLQNGNFKGSTISNTDPLPLINSLGVSDANFSNNPYYINPSVKPKAKSYTALLGFQFKNKQGTDYRTKSQLRLGLSYDNESIYFSQMKSWNGFYDSVTTGNGQKIALDSTLQRKYTAIYKYKQVRLDISYIFKTNPEQRWSLYSGVGLTSGFSVQTQTDILYYQSEKILANSTAFNPGYSYYSSQNFKNKTNFSISGYIPVGVDFRLGNKKESWKKIHLFYETRLIVSATFAPEIKQIVNQFRQQSIGLRINLL